MLCFLKISVNVIESERRFYQNIEVIKPSYDLLLVYVIVKLFANVDL